MDSETLRIEALSSDAITKIKVEPDEIHESSINISEQIDTTSESSKLSQNIDKACELMTGNFC